MRDIFTSHYQNNFWSNDESVSGHGSTLKATKMVRKYIPQVVRFLNIKTILDIPCGDYNWFGKIELPDGVEYIGADIVPELIYENNQKYARPGVSFMDLDITRDWLPKADLVICRDLLGHLSNNEVKVALQHIKRSGMKYLLATTFPDHETSGDIETGQWRPINLASLYGMPNPIEYIRENCSLPGFEDKSLGLWEL